MSKAIVNIYHNVLVVMVPRSKFITRREVMLWFWLGKVLPSARTNIQPINGVDFSRVAVTSNQVHCLFTVQHNGTGTRQARRYISARYTLCPVKTQ